MKHINILIGYHKEITNPGKSSAYIENIEEKILLKLLQK